MLIGKTPFVADVNPQRLASFRGRKGGRTTKSSMDADARIIASIAEVQAKGFKLSRAVSLALLDIDGCLDLLLGLLEAVPGSR